MIEARLEDLAMIFEEWRARYKSSFDHDESCVEDDDEYPTRAAKLFLEIAMDLELIDD